MKDIDTISQELKEKLENGRAFVPSHAEPPAPHTGICDADCEYCGGVGWYRVDVPVHHAHFGKLLQCPNLNMVTVMKDKSGLIGEELGWEWSKVWDLGNAIQASHMLDRTLDSGYGWAFIWGSYGVAKTLLLKVATAMALRRGLPACYVRMASIIDDLRDAYNHDESAEARLQFWTDVPVLCIDEFDRMRETEYASERRFVLMDKRYESAQRKKSITFMTSNTEPDQLPGYLADRIFDGRFDVIRVTGKNDKSVRPAMFWEDV